MAGRVLLRCDADARMGSGHFFRCLALAEGITACAGEALLVMLSPAPALLAHAAAAGVEVEVLRVDDPRVLAQRASGCAALLIDGYHFDASYFEQARGGAPVYALDDVGDRVLRIDGVINVGPHAASVEYVGLSPGAVRLLGVQYTLLRGQFRHERSRLDREGHPTRDEVTRVLVTMGGADASDETSKVLEGIKQHGFEGEVTVVLGPNAAHVEHVRDVMRGAARSWRLVEDVREMATLMAAQDVAISAGGGTSWEMACLGLPALQITVADNQRAQQALLSSRGVVRALGWRQDVDAAHIARALEGVRAAGVRAQMRQAGMALIDGQGALRVARALLGDV